METKEIWAMEEGRIQDLGRHQRSVQRVAIAITAMAITDKA